MSPWTIYPDHLEKASFILSSDIFSERFENKLKKIFSRFHQTKLDGKINYGWYLQGLYHCKPSISMLHMLPTTKMQPTITGQPHTKVRVIKYLLFPLLAMFSTDILLWIRSRWPPTEGSYYNNCWERTERTDSWETKRIQWLVHW